MSKKWYSIYQYVTDSDIVQEGEPMFGTTRRWTFEQMDTDNNVLHDMSRELSEAISPLISKERPWGEELHWTDENFDPYTGTINETRRLLMTMEVSEVFRWVVRGHGNPEPWQECRTRQYQGFKPDIRQAIDGYFMALRARGDLTNHAWERFGILFWSIPRSISESA